ncbi:hypothetical protein PINS_up011733 [Pythium insidiosum]|nr:hypothetical protein PINS_up011733 [Pythium insidiosum]
MRLLSHAERPLFVSLSPRARRAVWLLSVAVHTLVTGFLLLHATFYLACLSWPRVRYFAATYQLLSNDELPLAAAAYIAMALAFVASLLRMLHGSRRRRVAVADAAVDAGVDVGAKQSSRIRSASISASASSASRPSGGSGCGCVISVRAVLAFFSIGGDGYEVGTTLRGALQVTFQSLQAFDFSRSTPTLSLNAAFSLLVLASCVALPLVERSAPRDVARRRVRMLLVDVALDAAWLALPMLLWPKYLGDFFNEEVKYYEDTYNARALLELQLVSAHSIVSVLVKLLPCLGLLATFSKIHATVLHVGRPTRNLLSGRRSYTAAPASSITSNWIWMIKRILDAVLALWGVSVVVISLVAYATPPPTCEIGCKLVVRPWFVAPTYCRCAVQEINCALRGLRGSTDEIATALRQLDSRRTFDADRDALPGTRDAGGTARVSRSLRARDLQLVSRGVRRPRRNLGLALSPTRDAHDITVQFVRDSDGAARR